MVGILVCCAEFPPAALAFGFGREEPEKMDPEILEELLQMGAEVAPACPIPVALEGCKELECILEPDEMEF